MRENWTQDESINRLIVQWKPEVHGRPRPVRVVKLMLGVEVVKGKIRMLRSDILLAPQDRVPRHVNTYVAASVPQQRKQLKGITSDPATDLHNRHVGLQPDMLAIRFDVGLADLVQPLGARAGEIDQVDRNFVAFEFEE